MHFSNPFLSFVIVQLTGALESYCIAFASTYLCKFCQIKIRKESNNLTFHKQHQEYIGDK